MSVSRETSSEADTRLSMGVYAPPVKKLFSMLVAAFDSTISNIFFFPYDPAVPIKSNYFGVSAIHSFVKFIATSTIPIPTGTAKSNCSLFPAQIIILNPYCYIFFAKILF